MLLIDKVIDCVVNVSGKLYRECSWILVSTFAHHRVHQHSRICTKQTTGPGPAISIQTAPLQLLSPVYGADSQRASRGVWVYSVKSAALLAKALERS